MSFPKKGKTFPPSASTSSGAEGYSRAIGEALRQELGGTNQAIKVLARWTGVNERTAKNWIAGKNGPSGENLIALIRHSDIVLKVVLYLAGRRQAVAAEELSRAREVLSEIADLIRTLSE